MKKEGKTCELGRLRNNEGLYGMIEETELTSLVLEDERLVFDPITAIEVPLPGDAFGVRAMNVTANHAATVVSFGQMDHEMLEVGDMLAGPSAAQFNSRTPMFAALVGPDAVAMQGFAEPNQFRIQPATEALPRRATIVGLKIEDVAVSHQQLHAGERFVYRVGLNVPVGVGRNFGQLPIMIAGEDRDLGPLMLKSLQRIEKGLDRVLGIQVKSIEPLERITDQVEFLGTAFGEETIQQTRLRESPAEMNIAKEDASCVGKNPFQRGALQARHNCRAVDEKRA